jgi:hypothetical protein
MPGEVPPGISLMRRVNQVVLTFSFFCASAVLGHRQTPVVERRLDLLRIDGIGHTEPAGTSNSPFGQIVV